MRQASKETISVVVKRIKGQGNETIFFSYKACPNGYYWINCSRPCRYPRFGRRCSQICVCEKDNCDHMSGCKKGNKNITVQSVKHVVSSATYDVYKATTVDLCITNGSSSTTHNVSNVSSDVLNNPLFISLLIISIIICLIIVAYVPIRSIEKYWIQLNQGGEDSGAI